jgi:hypothetical protein
MVEAHCVHGVGEGISTGPKGQCVGQLQFAIERQIFIGKRGFGALNMTGRRPQEPGGKANEARLAAAVRAGDVKRLTSVEVKVEAFEEQPAATDQRDSVGVQQSHASSSSRCMSSSLSPK